MVHLLKETPFYNGMELIKLIKYAADRNKENGMQTISSEIQIISEENQEN